MGGSSSSHDSSSNSHPKSWLFPEDDYSTDAYAQAAGTGGIVGAILGGGSGAAGGSIAGPGGAGAGLLGGAVSGGIGGAGDSSSSSRPQSWLFPKEDDCSAGAHYQAAGKGGIVGTVIGSIASAVGGIFSGSGGVAKGFVNGAIGGGLAGAGDALADKYNKCHTAPSCETSDYVAEAAIHGGIGAAVSLATGPGAFVGGLGGAADGLIDKYNECHPNPSCEVSDYIESVAIKAGAGALIGALAGPEGAVTGGVMGAANGFINKYDQCHP
ncbi:hypothetical protein [Bartonella sp. AU15XJBT]|uniref:hypothetical protein n=1 Tax=Bartonella sp. AU15XJBT TaxID=3019087 RepID=UPI00236112DF|nr:hypothetical protein [Bartonella sp. AU15XJBT]